MLPNICILLRAAPAEARSGAVSLSENNNNKLVATATFSAQGLGFLMYLQVYLLIPYCRLCRKINNN